MDYTTTQSNAKRLRTAAGYGLVLAALACTQASFADSATGVVGIDITNFAYAPKEVTVAPGTKIVWTNRDETPHTVTSRGKVFDSKALDTGDKFEYTFEREGEFAYYCTVHPFMTGVVHVRQNR